MISKVKNKFKNLDQSDRWCLLIFVVINIALGTMLYLNMRYFYYDNPTVLSYNMESVKGLFFTKVERFFPMTFVIQGLTSQFISSSPVAHYMVQFLYYLIGACGLFALLNDLKIKFSYQCFLVLLLEMCTTFSENMFTIGKMELLVSVCLIYFIRSLYSLVLHNKKRQIGNFLIYEISIAIALLTKETALIMLVPVGLLFIYAYLFDKERFPRVVKVAFILVCNIVALQIYKHIYVVQGEYTSFDLSIKSYLYNLVWYLQNHFDIMLIGFIGGGVSLIQWIKDRKNLQPAFLLMVNLTGWAYLLAMSMWRWALSYYLYPMVPLFAISFAGIFIYKYHIKLCLAVSFLPLLYAVNYNYKVAVSHIDVGQVYSESIDSIISLTPEGGRVLMENLNFFEEPIHQTNLLMKQLNHEVDVLGIYQELTGNELDESVLQMYGYSLEDYEQLKSTFRPQVGDYIVVYLNQRSFRGAVRGINPSGLYNGGDSMLTNSKYGYKLELVDKNTIKRQWISLGNRSLKQTTEAGYLIYKVVECGLQISGMYEDGWSGEIVTVTSLNPDRIIKINTGTMACAWRGITNNSIDIIVNDEIVNTVELDSSKSSFVLNDYVKYFSSNDVISLKVKNVDSPKNYGSADDRILGIMMDIQVE